MDPSLPPEPPVKSCDVAATPERAGQIWSAKLDLRDVVMSVKSPLPPDPPVPQLQPPSAGREQKHSASEPSPFHPPTKFWVHSTRTTPCSPAVRQRPGAVIRGVAMRSVSRSGTSLQTLASGVASLRWCDPARSRADHICGWTEAGLVRCVATLALSSVMADLASCIPAS